MNKRAKPKIQLNVRVDEKLNAKLDKLAAKAGIRKVELVTKALEAYADERA